VDTGHLVLYGEHSNKRGGVTHAANVGLDETERADIGEWTNMKTTRLYIDQTTSKKHETLMRLQ